MFKKRSPQSHIITIDAYAQSSFVLSGRDFAPFNITHPLPVKNENFYISYLKFRQFLNASIEIEPSVSDAELSNVIFNKTYEELGLDGEIDYKIAYLQASLSDERRIFNVFVAPTQTLENQFLTTAENTSCIDYIVPAPLLYEALYRSGSTPADDVECFLHLDKDDAFIALYKFDEFLGARSVRYSLNFIKDKFCELTGERISEQAFYDVLQTSGICEHQDDAFSTNLNYVLNDCFFYISDVINSLNRMYNVQTNFVYIDAFCGQIAGMCEFATKILNLPCAPIKFSIYSKHQDFSPTHALLGLYAQCFLNGAIDELNFSIFRRPEPFFDRPSGKLLLHTACACALTFVYPAYNYASGYFSLLKHSALQSEFNELTEHTKSINTQLSDLNKSRSTLVLALEKEEQKLKFRKNLLDDISNKKLNYSMKGVVLFEISSMLNQADVSIKSYSTSENNVTIEAVSQNERNITEFLKLILENQKYTAQTRQILQTNGMFESNVSIGVR